MKTPKQDNRPRFGYCLNLDADPQRIHEIKSPVKGSKERAVVVIPLQFNSASTRKMCREFAGYMNETRWVLTKK